MNKYKPTGWKYESARHSLAAKGIKTKIDYMSFEPYYKGKFFKVEQSPAFVLNLSAKIKKKLAPLSAKLDLAGSIRRKTPPADIDIVMVPKDKGKVLRLLSKIGTVEQHGEKKITAIVDGVKVDVMFATPQDYGAQLLTATGPAGSNIGLRIKAKQMGYKLNQYGLFQDDKLIASKTEEDILRALHHDFKPPEMRGK